MKYDDDHLAELLRALPAPPVHVVAGAKALFDHLVPDAEPVSDDSGMDDETPSAHSDDDMLAPSDDDFDPFDGSPDDHDADGDGWS